MNQNKERKRLPPWLRRRLPHGCAPTASIIEDQQVHTVCQEAKCPNQMECWAKRTATFLVMGNECTRSCGFCDIAYNKTPKPLDPQEPQRIAESVRQLQLKHVVITMVTRDDLPDGGANHLVKILEEVRKQNPNATVEVLTSDFDGNFEALQTILESSPEVFNHNVETVRDLSPRVRHRATYDRSLAILEYVRNHSDIIVKSGLMVGLGETDQQVQKTLDDLHGVGCDIVTIGQYLQPCSKRLQVKTFITPEQFINYKKYGLSIGISQMVCGPFVRSSYHAQDLIKNKIHK